LPNSNGQTMSLRLYNTRTRTVEPFQPLQGDHARVYVCGLTPSAEAHLGHARSFLFFDVLRRYLEHPRNAYRVTFVRNVTDIDDRSIATARQEGTTFDAVIARFYVSFQASMRRLGVREPDIEPYATKSIPEIQTMIEALIAGGHAYASRDGIYFSVATFPRYGALSGKHVDELLVGARIAENEDKRDPLDFALWKFRREGDPAWDWRTDSALPESAGWSGRPGWHIECSAMIAETFGLTTIDIHGGGYDLIFPHHENEVAQSESLIPQTPQPHPFANFWVHGGLLNFEGRKMSKSLGNFEPLSALLERHDPLALRLLFLQTGYRKPMNFTEDSIAGAESALEKLRRGYAVLSGEIANPAPPAPGGPAVEVYEERFFEALDDDINTAGAVGVLFDLVGALPRHPDSAQREGGAVLLHDAFGLLGLGPLLDRPLHAQRAVTLATDLSQRLAARLGDTVHLNGEAPEAAVQALIDARAAARKNKDFALGDRLRDALAAEGIVLKDSKDGTTWTVAAS
jgi:cysteinyl-tRNA synthetase